jgi:hypothetical protein
MTPDMPSSDQLPGSSDPLLNSTDHLASMQLDLYRQSSAEGDEQQSDSQQNEAEATLDGSMSLDALNSHPHGHSEVYSSASLSGKKSELTRYSRWVVGFVLL